MRSVLICIFLCYFSGAALAEPPLKRLETPSYTIYTDLDSDAIKEAGLRLTRMLNVYRTETGDLADSPGHKFPCYLYRSADDYFAAGGTPGTVGWFITDPTGGKLMAVAGQTLSLQTWHAVQHEGFHQYAHAVLRDGLPAWLNEGLAEYFGEAIFTGDGYVTGLIPPWRLQRLQASIHDKKLIPLATLSQLSADQWHNQMKLASYDQAWSFIHYLMHGEKGKYRPRLLAFLSEIAGGRTADRAWADTLDPIPTYEKRWSTYWETHPPDPTADLYATALFQTFSSFLVRASNNGRYFDSFAEFADTANNGQLKINPKEWLPPALLHDALAVSGNYGMWSLNADKTGQPTLNALLKDGTKLSAQLVPNAASPAPLPPPRR